MDDPLRELETRREDARRANPLSIPGRCLLVVSVDRRVQRRSKISTQPPQPTQEPRSGPLTFRKIIFHVDPGFFFLL